MGKSHVPLVGSAQLLKPTVYCRISAPRALLHATCRLITMRTFHRHWRFLTSYEVDHQCLHCRQVDAMAEFLCLRRSQKGLETKLQGLRRQLLMNLGNSLSRSCCPGVQHTQAWPCLTRQRP